MKKSPPPLSRDEPSLSKNDRRGSKSWSRTTVKPQVDQRSEGNVINIAMARGSEQGHPHRTWALKYRYLSRHIEEEVRIPQARTQKHSISQLRSSGVCAADPWGVRGWGLHPMETSPSYNQSPEQWVSVSGTF